MADTASFPEKTHYTVEPHGQGWAIYRGRDFEHHGLNLGQLTECLPETALLVQRALNILTSVEVRASPQWTPEELEVIATSSGPGQIDVIPPPAAARALLEDARMVLEMVRANERVRYGGKGRAWDGKFVSAEVERIIQALGSALASAPSAEHPAVVDEAAARRLDVRAAARAAALGDHWEHMGEPAREAMRQRVRDEEGAT